MAVDQPKRITAAPFLKAFPEYDGVRRELIDGEVLVAPSPSGRHQQIVTRLAIAFGTYLDTHGGGQAIVGPMDILLSDDFVPEPDFVFMAAGFDPRNPKNVVGPPSLVVEVVSGPRRDLRVKRDRYERYGVPEYWAIVMDADQVQVFRLVDGGYAKPALMEPGDELSPLELPGLSIDVGRLLRP